MKMKLAKTFTHHFQPLQKVMVATDEEVEKQMQKYDYACEFVKAGCSQRFKTKTGMKIHTCNCNYNYGLTDAKWEVERIIGVFGNSSRKLFLVQWTGRPGEDSWQKEHSLLEDGCAQSIKQFWDQSGKNPALDFYPDPEGEPGTRCWMCGWKNSAKNKQLGLKTHIRRKQHRWSKRRSHLAERKDIKLKKLTELQKQLPKVRWGNKDIDNSLLFLYLGSLFQTDGDQTPDVLSKCARTKARAGTLRHIWAADLPMDLKLRLYISACCSILVYGSEGWLLNEETCRHINGVNAYMLSHITGKTKQEEVTTATTTFNIIAWIRARRLRWVGHIMRLSPNSNKEPRQLKETLRVIFDNRQEGDILMDVPETTWAELEKATADRKTWRKRVQVIKAAARSSTATSATKAPTTTTTTHTIRSQRFTCFPKKFKIGDTTKVKP